MFEAFFQYVWLKEFDACLMRKCEAEENVGFASVGKEPYARES